MTFRKQTSWLSGKQASPSRLVLASVATTLAVILNACSSSVTVPKSTASGPQLYMTPTIYEGAAGVTYTNSVATVSIDDAALTFAQKTYSAQTGAQVNYSGELVSPPLARGLKELELLYACGATTGTCASISPTNPPSSSGWAVELADQSGGLEQLTGQAFVPMVPAVTCPSMSIPESFLFVTLPEPLGDWNPTHTTAYGSVDISASGSTVTFASINQYNLAGSLIAPASSQTGVCSSTVFGNTIAIPGNISSTTIPPAPTVVTPQAMVAIGPSGMLVEDSGGTSYLGASTGAIGLPKPSGTVDTSALVGAQYLGFFYGSGTTPASSPNWSSSVASFGFPSLPSTCPTLSNGTLSNPIYGGDFLNDNPGALAVQAHSGYPVDNNGNYQCDLTIDLGPTQPTNGLFSSAKVYVGSGFAANKTGKSYSFSAVAIAGQLNGKYAIFLVGEDTTGTPNQAWGIYLLQSN